MSHKFSLIPLGIIVLVGAVWASSSLFPDKPSDGFASLPTGAGTLGQVLKGFFDASGNATNALNMAGQPANTYLRGDTCVSPNVWKGTDASGKIICGTKIRVLAQVGRITAVGGSVTVITEDGATSKAAVVGDILKEGARIQTAGGGSATVTFTDDLSIVRLDQNTRIDIKLPETTSPTSGSIASVIVSNGVIWGRVLTTDGVEFGGGGLIAGVRGTSIRLDRFNSATTGGDTFRISIPHSRTPTAAATIYTTDGQIVTTAQAGENYLYEPMTAGSALTRFRVAPVRYTDATDSTVVYPSLVPNMQGLTYFYGNSSSAMLIKANVLQDITYLKSKRDTLPTGPTRTIVQEELAATVPTVEQDRINLCNTGTPTTSGYWYEDGQYGCVFAYADANTNYDLNWRNGMRKWEMIAKKRLSSSDVTGDGGNLNNNNFPDGTIGTGTTGVGFNGTRKYTPLSMAFGTHTDWYNGTCPNGNNPFCTTIKNAISSGYKGIIVDVTGSPYNNIELLDGFYWDRWTFPKVDTISGGSEISRFTAGLNQPNPNSLNINETGKYLTFAGSGQTALQNLQGTTTANYGFLAGKTITIELGGTPTSNGVLVDFGTTNYRIQRFGTGYTCYWPGAPTPCATTNGNTVTFRAPTSGITAFIIGNNSLQMGPTTPFTRPIGAAINKVIISN